MTSEAILWALGVLAGMLLHSVHAPTPFVVVIVGAGMVAISSLVE